MTAIRLRDDVKVTLRRHTPDGDLSVAEAAWISTENEPRAHEEGRIPGLINYLIEERHGSPFEHNSATFRVEAPIMVFREWHRHRIQSFNEQSGRYTPFLPNFYAPPRGRVLVNKSGKSSRPDFTGEDDPELWAFFTEDLAAGYQEAWDRYEKYRSTDIANEMARLILPVSVYSSMYVTANLRAWLHFLSLRTSESNATYQGHPQQEIVWGAKEIEAELTKLYPITLAAFNKHGRVAP